MSGDRDQSAREGQRRSRRIVAVLLFAAMVASGIIALRQSARIIVLNRPRPADVILIVTSDPYSDDLYYRRALQLLGQHYGQSVLLPADATGTPGQTEADEARSFIDATAGAQRGRVAVCPEGDDEYRSVDACLNRLHARTVLMVAPAPESRRSFLLYQDHLPNYSWYVAAIADPTTFGTRWWSNRQWAKSYVESLQRLVIASVER